MWHLNSIPLLTTFCRSFHTFEAFHVSPSEFYTCRKQSQVSPLSQVIQFGHQKFGCVSASKLLALRSTRPSTVCTIQIEHEHDKPQSILSNKKWWHLLLDLLIHTVGIVLTYSFFDLTHGFFCGLVPACRGKETFSLSYLCSAAKNRSVEHNIVGMPYRHCKV